MIATTRFLFLATCLMLVVLPARAADPAVECSMRVAQWLNPADGTIVEPQALYDRLAQRPVVLLGEVHDNADHHRWQLAALTALHSRNPNLVIGLEMMPRRLQPVLDAWSRGALDEDAFLEQSEWDQVWGYDPALYLPILHYARIHRLPVVALNVERELVSRVGAEGWDAVADDAREGLTDPAPALPAYRRNLAELFAYKMMMGLHSGAEEVAEPDLEAVMESEAFNNFVDAQLTWDRAMAEALATAHRLDSDALVVGIVGRGHLEYGHGIPHQLADLGIDETTVLLPVERKIDCDSLEAGLAEAVFVIDSQEGAEPPPKPRLGVLIETVEQGVRVSEVVEASVAASSGLEAGDIIVRAAGFETATAASLVEVIQRQSPGTWLPLEILRDGETLELVARFPQSFE